MLLKCSQFDKVESLQYNFAREKQIKYVKHLLEILCFYRYCLCRTLHQCQLMLEFLESVKKELKWHGRQEHETAHYCNDCEVR